ncbi:MAG: hypothetical protein U0975_07660 [Erythrobacter sp.]|nr:hypothetical protein [Erythrobacter sp.]MDZ4272535.1 hypothetical protein [Erythrobacter sp.]
MGVPFWAGVFGLVVSIIFLLRAVIELRKNTPGHARNAAIIHVGMAALFLPFSLIIMFLYL